MFKPYKLLGLGGCGVRWFTRYHAHLARIEGRDKSDIGRLNKVHFFFFFFLVNKFII